MTPLQEEKQLLMFQKHKNRDDFVTQINEIKFSELRHWLTVWPWLSHLISASSIFPSYNKRETVSLLQ